MSRQKCCKKVDCLPVANYYRPGDDFNQPCDEVVLTLDEFEAIRLADYTGLYQEDAAERMNVSRQTFGRIVASAHKKIADVLINGKALRIEGGIVSSENALCMRCLHCTNAAGCQHKSNSGNCPRGKNGPEDKMIIKGEVK